MFPEPLPLRLDVAQKSPVNLGRHKAKARLPIKESGPSVILTVSQEPLNRRWHAP